MLPIIKELNIELAFLVSPISLYLLAITQNKTVIVIRRCCPSIISNLLEEFFVSEKTNEPIK